MYTGQRGAISAIWPLSYIILYIIRVIVSVIVIKLLYAILSLKFEPFEPNWAKLMPTQSRRTQDPKPKLDTQTEAEDSKSALCGSTTNQPEVETPLVEALARPWLCKRPPR